MYIYMRATRIERSEGSANHASARSIDGVSRRYSGFKVPRRFSFEL